MLHFLNSNRSCFLLGNTAPDVQTISGQSRQVTHFFDLPIRSNDLNPWDIFLLRHPVFARLDKMTENHAAFILGYLCHLQADWLWMKEIFLPFFSLKTGWFTLPNRIYLHNGLRAYLDFQIHPTLPDDLGTVLEASIPDHWLPFVEDRYLVQWRDLLSHQLYPGASIKTVEVFATRQGVPPEQYYNLIQSEERLEAEIFDRLPRQKLQFFRQQLLEANMKLLTQLACV